MRMIADNIKKDILAYGADNIVAIIARYVPLKKSARAYTACCPFHQEKTPSFTVDPGRRTWHCFGACSEGGDVAKFLMKIDGISFPAALEVLARKGGIDIPHGDMKEERERKGMLHVLEKVQQFYHNSLLQNQNGAKAYVGSRMTEDMVKQFGVGFAPVGAQTLVEFLSKEKLPLDVAEKAGDA